MPRRVRSTADVHRRLVARSHRGCRCWRQATGTQVAWWVNWAPAACLVGPVLRLPDQPAPARTVRRLSVATWIVTVGLLVVAGLFWDPEPSQV